MRLWSTASRLPRPPLTTSLLTVCLLCLKRVIFFTCTLDTETLIHLSFGQAVSQARKAFLDSPTPTVLTRATCDGFALAFASFQAGMQVALQHERYAVHVFNGAASLHTLALTLVASKQHHTALTYLLWVIFALENCLP